MSHLTLYKLCLRRVFTNLRNGFYRNNNKNPFTQLPFTVADFIMSSALPQLRENVLSVDDLQKLLISNRLSELVSNIRERDLTTEEPLLIQILTILKSGSKNLHKLHLLLLNVHFEYWGTRLTPGLSEALQNLFPITLNLKYLDCCFQFDLTTLKNCRKLRKLSLHFKPLECWQEFLESDDEGIFKTHECMEYFNVCPKHVSQENLPNHDIMAILHYCPELVSLGLIESSRALSQFSEILPTKLKLRHCYWKDMESPNDGPHLVRDAINICPLIEDLELDNCNSRTLPFLTNLKNIVCLNITVNDSVTCDDFNNAMREIVPSLKHFCFKASKPMDISLLLQNCYNLESLKMFGNESSEFAHTSVELPKLQRLTIDYTEEEGNDGRVFRLLRSCNQLTDLFFINISFDEEILPCFLGNNSLSNLKVAYLSESYFTKQDIREFLQNAPELEIVHVYVDDDFDVFVDNFKIVISETKHKVNLFNDFVFLRQDEFFEKKKGRYRCSVY